MNRDTFIKKLENELIKGGINKVDIKDTCEYYKGYFEEKLATGCTEKEILDELGEPRLIAKTIIDTSNKGHASRQGSRDIYKDNTEYSNRNEKSFEKLFTIKNKLVIALIVVAIIALLLFLFVFAIKIFIYCLPVLIVIGIIRFLLR